MEALLQFTQSTLDSNASRESENSQRQAFQDNSGLSGLSTEVKKWLYMPTHQTEERQAMCRDLETIESRLFTKQSMLDTCLMECDAITKEIETCDEPIKRAALEAKLNQLRPKDESYREIVNLEATRSELLNEYWKKYFKSEWPSVGAIANATRIRTAMTSPNLQLAAEKMMAMRASAGIPMNGGSGWGNDRTPLSPQTEARKTKKRMLESIPIAGGAALTFQSSAISENGDSPSKEDEETDPALVRCNCKKSRCLKLYCECFAARKMCVDECKCLDCANNLEHSKKRDEAIKQVLERRPDAFHTKVYVATVGNGITTKTTASAATSFVINEADAPVALAHARGCSCRRTKCTKKYCVCYNTQVKCGDWCRCVGCENGKVESSASGGLNDMPGPTDKLSVLANITAAASPVHAQVT